MKKNSASVLPVKYIGRHGNGREDKLYRTSTVWESIGDIQFVPRAAALKMVKRHPDNFMIVTGKELEEFLSKGKDDPRETLVSDAERAAREVEDKKKADDDAKAEALAAAVELEQALERVETREDLLRFIHLNDETSGMPLHKNKKIETLKEEVKDRLVQSGKIL